MGILHKNTILERMGETKYQKKLLVTPILDDDQIGPASIDVRLGSSIIVPKRTYVGSQDVTDPEIISQVERRLYEKIKLKYRTPFILHPSQLILGVTFEYISLPFDIFASIVSRSSWGRLGLVVATASVVQPGFKGALTLELCNMSESPITLYPGLTIGQLVFYDVPSKASKEMYKGRYDCPTEAGLPQFFKTKSDNEMSFWRPRNEGI